MIGALSGSGGYAAASLYTNTRLKAETQQSGKGGAASSQNSSSESKQSASSSANGLTDEQQRVVDKLKQREAEVRAHEQAHQMAGGAYAGSPTYTTTQGPDGKRYITGGEVSIDVSPEDDPQATISKMEQVKRAALAPADPSSQDRAVAQQAEATKAQAQAELNKQRQEQLRDDDETADEGVNGLTQQRAQANKAEGISAGKSRAYGQASSAYQTAQAIIGAIQGVGVTA